MKSSAHLLAAAIVVALPVAISQAETAPANDRMTLANNISRDLGVSTTQFIGCVQRVRPVVQSMAPGSGRQEARNALLLPCIQQANPQMTSEAFLTVMNKYQPAPAAN